MSGARTGAHDRHPSEQLGEQRPAAKRQQQGVGNIGLAFQRNGRAEVAVQLPR